MIRKAALWIAFAGLAGCGGRNASLPPSGPSTLPMARATFTMHWPGVSSSGQFVHRDFISKSTKSVVIEINGDASLTTMMNNPSTTAQGAVTNISMSAPPGNDSITFSLFDQPQQQGETTPAGNELGQVTIAQTIAAGKANVINAVIDGIVTSVDVAPLPNQPTVVAGSATPSYTISGDFPVTFAVTPKDADGNVIVANGTPITYSASSSSTAVSANMVNGQPNEFTLQTVQAPSPGANIGVVIQATGGASTIAQSNIGISLASVMYAGYKNSGSGSIAAFSQSGTPIPVQGGFPGITSPISMSYDPGGHHLYVLDGINEAIHEFNTDGTAVATYASPTVAAANAISFDANNNLLYVSTPTTVVAFNASGSPATLGGSFANISNAVGIYAYADLASGIYKLFVANAGNNTVSWYKEDGTPGPTTPLFRTPWFSTGTLVPSAIAGDPGTTSLYLLGIDSGSPSAASFGLFGAAQGKTSASLASPAAIGFNALAGQVYIGNASGAITVYDNRFSNLITTIQSPAGFSNPASFAFVY